MDQHQHGHDASRKECSGCGSKAAEGTAAATATDPVCGMTVDPATSKHRIDQAGTTYHVCSAGCRTKFEADPAKYLAPKPGAPRPAAAPDHAISTCPMHSQIRHKGPGSCSICGMALEPVEITAEAAPGHELTDMTRRF